MASHQIFGHVVVIFYCTIFGIAFSIASALYLVTLHRVESSQSARCPQGFELLPTPIPLSISSSSLPPSGLNGCNGEVLHNWRLWANMGLVYGIVWFFLGIFLLWPIMWRVCFVNNPNISMQDAATLPLANKRRKGGQAFKNMAANIITVHQQLLQEGQLKKQQRMDEVKEARFWSSCGSCLKITYIALINLVMMGLWLTTLIVPGLIAISLGATHAFQPMDRQLHSPALSLFSVCILSLIFVIVSSCALLCDNTENWNSMDTSSSSSSFDSDEKRKRPGGDGGDLEAGREQGLAKG